MPKFIDLTGKKYGNLLVIERAPNNGKRVMFRCLCDCGNETITRSHSLTSGHTSSCGCVSLSRLKEQREKHLKSRTRTYRIWVGMRARCRDSSIDCNEHYAGRGISVCERWESSFENFLEDMGVAPSGYSIDRKNNDGGYNPDNCRWATDKEQSRNKRTNIIIECGNKKQCVSDWAEELNMNVHTLYARVVRYNWTIERAFTTPVRKKIRPRYELYD